MDFSAQFAVPWENAERYFWDSEILSEVGDGVNIILREIIEDHRAREFFKK
jgi:hypothetical protein